MKTCRHDALPRLAGSDAQVSGDWCRGAAGDMDWSWTLHAFVLWSSTVHRPLIEPMLWASGYPAGWPVAIAYLLRYLLFITI